MIDKTNGIQDIDLPINGEIKEKLERTQRELDVLYEVSCAMRTTLELNHVLYIILTGVTSHAGLGYNRAILFLLNPKKRMLECKMFIGPESGEEADRIWKYFEASKPQMDDLIKEDKVHTLETSSYYETLKSLNFPIAPENLFILTKAFWRATPWHLSHAELSEYASDPLFQHFKTNDLVIMPLRAKDKVNGLIIADNIYTKKPITDEDIKIFTMLADQAALAIENSHLYEMIVNKSHKDSLTNLWNHGFFQNKLSEKLEEAQETDKPLSLLMIDIDNFKATNDLFGHQYGDLILKEIAQLLSDSSREMDYICRYGGEEFSIILHQTNKEVAFEIAERLRKKICNNRFPHPSDPESHFTITTSIGLASFPEHAQSKEELVTYADKAMYIAKFSGKNKTCVTGINE